MSDFFAIFQPGLQHAREQRDFEKIRIVEAPKGGDGPQPLDIDSGVVTIVPRPAEASAEAQTAADGEVERHEEH